MIKKILIFLKDISIVIFMVILLSLSFWGTRLPYKFPVVNVGSYHLASFDTGLALYQVNRDSPFYGFSPLNDYYLTINGFRQLHLTRQEFNLGSYETSLDAPQHQQLWQAMQAYLGNLDPFYTFKKGSLTVNYQTKKIDEKTITLEKTVSFDQPQPTLGQAITVTYGPDDIVFDPESERIFAGGTNRDHAIINTIYGSRLYLDSLPSKEVLSSKKISLINTKVPGVTTIVLKPEQELVIDPIFRIIEIVERKSTYSRRITMGVTIYGESLLGADL